MIFNKIGLCSGLYYPHVGVIRPIVKIVLLQHCKTITGCAVAQALC